MLIRPFSAVPHVRPARASLRLYWLRCRDPIRDIWVSVSSCTSIVLYTHYESIDSLVFSSSRHPRRRRRRRLRRRHADASLSVFRAASYLGVAYSIMVGLSGLLGSLESLLPVGDRCLVSGTAGRADVHDVRIIGRFREIREEQPGSIQSPGRLQPDDWIWSTNTRAIEDQRACGIITRSSRGIMSFRQRSESECHWQRNPTIDSFGQVSRECPVATTFCIDPIDPGWSPIPLVKAMISKEPGARSLSLTLKRKGDDSSLFPMAIHQIDSYRSDLYILTVYTLPSRSPCS